MAGRRPAAFGQGHARSAACGRRGRPAAGVRALRILLLGANGQVGTELQRSLAPLGEVVAATRNGLLASGSSCEVADFDRPEELQPLIARTAPDVVVNAVAHTAVDRAESEPDTAFRANAQAPGQLAAACAIDRKSTRLNSSH